MKTFVVAMFAAVMLAACGTTHHDRTLSGAGIGAGIGLLAGGPIGAVIGGAVGAGTGAVTNPSDVYLGEPVWN